jgi:hypothetical protein
MSRAQPRAALGLGEDILECMFGWALDGEGDATTGAELLMQVIL